MSTATQTPDRSPEATAFLADVDHVPDQIPDDRTKNFSEIKDEEKQDLGEGSIGWTAEEIAEIFNACFAFLTLAPLVLPLGGDHWAIPQEKCMKLGYAFLPIFQRHIPYESKPSWTPDFLLYAAALGAVKETIGPAIKEEMRQWKQRSQPRSTTGATTTASTATGTSSESSAPAESANQARPSESGYRSNFASVD